MPELPEVEKVRQDLESGWASRSTLTHLKFFRKDLRYPLPPPKRARALYGLRPQKFGRHGKFLVLKFPGYHLVSHLGMSGSWRWKQQGEQRRTHDHIEISLSDGSLLVYHDPRRFGSFEILSENEFASKKALSTMGPDPLLDELRAREFYERYRSSRRAIKVLLMDQRVIAGVGNIYACEVLFLAGAHPEKPASDVTLKEWTRILKVLPKLLKRSVAEGGTTLKDFVHTDGKKGGFQQRLHVYGRSHLACRKCSSLISSKVLGQRSTFWCPTCQTR